MKLQNLFKSLASVLVLTTSVFLGACSANDNPSGDEIPAPVPRTETSVTFTLKDSNSSSEINAVKAWVLIGNMTYIVLPDEASGKIQVSFLGISNGHVGLSAVTAEGRVWLANLSGMTFKNGNAYDQIVEMTEDEGVQLWEGGPKFASVNVGAASPADCGLFFAWGSTDDNTSLGKTYSWANTPFYTGDGTKHSWSKYTVSGETLDPEDDAAAVLWGGKWRIPTEAEMRELVNGCTYEMITIDGLRGCLFTSKTNGATIFFPASGDRSQDEVKAFNQMGFYWTSTVDREETKNAMILFLKDIPMVNSAFRFGGRPIRPVQ